MIIKNLYIIRHGETDFNNQNIVQGSGVDTSINATGENQAIRFFNAYKDIPFDVVYTSALKRTHQSVNAFLKSGIKHVILPELNEISWGIFEGKQQTDEQRAVYWELINGWNQGKLDTKIVNGESPIELQDRQRKITSQILENETEENILICMHGRALKSFLCLLLNIPLTQMEDFKHSNLCLYQLKKWGDKMELVLTNDVDHLS